jgi:SulP family sulfate permease
MRAMSWSDRGVSLSEAWGGLAAMLVALPSSIAFGLIMFTPLGPAQAGLGAMAGILGVVAIGIVAPLVGGTPRLVSAPCAPAAAVMGGLAGQLMASTAGGVAMSPGRAVLLMGLVGLACGLMQVLFGALGGGRLIKYVPYPVVAGYLSGVGVLIFLGQVPKLMGLPKEVSPWVGLLSPEHWRWPGMVVGAVTMAAMVLAPRVTKAVPAPIVGLACGMVAYFALSVPLPELATNLGNPLVIGPIQGAGASPLAAFTDRLSSLGELQVADLGLVAAPALTLAVLLSIDTLKTCVVVDALTRSRHDSNRELVGQGAGNVASAVLGGMPGAGTMGATLVNVSAGGQTRLSSVLVGLLALGTFLLLGDLVAWVPVAALAGILIVVAYRMFDRQSFYLLKQRSTAVDFAVVAAVILTAVLVNLIAAAGVGLALAILLFLRDQIRGSVVRRRALGSQIFSKKHRLPGEQAVLERRGDQTAIFELQGSLFFGTTDQLLTELGPHLPVRKAVILDMRRIRSVDFTAAHMLEQVEAQLRERGGTLVFADLPKSLPSGQDVERYFAQLGVLKHQSSVKTFASLDDALEWAEETVLQEEGVVSGEPQRPLSLGEIDMLAGLPEPVLEALAKVVREQSLGAGQKLFSQGEAGDELFMIRRGSIRILLDVGGGKHHHLATFGRADHLGDMSFLDRNARSADAVASAPTDLYVLSRAEFDRACDDHPVLGQHVFARLARTLAIRLRSTDREVRVLQEA